MLVKPVSIELELKDPLEVYARVRGKNSYLLESAEGGEKVARYSFIGINPAAKLTFQGKPKLEIMDKELKLREPKGGNPLETMKTLSRQMFFLGNPELSRFFGGFVGYFSYDIVRHLIELDGSSKDDLKQPDCEFLLAKNNIIFDHLEGKTFLTENTFLEANNELDEETVVKRLKELAYNIKTGKGIEFEEKKGCPGLQGNMTKKEYEGMVKDAKAYIKAGDIFQVVLSQRFETEFHGDKFRAFMALKEINPSPYMYFLDLGKRKICGSSPEMLARVENRQVMTYPIAGTRKRGDSPEEDRLLATEMLRDEKERAEHIMLVDLGRNDVGRVAEYGSVHVNKLMKVEKYSHVQHMVSEVVGTLAQDKDEFDALESIFPAGTVSGAPKVRAMEIIEELEPTRRGIYAGSVGYFAFTRNMDTAITIRTLVFEEDKAYMQAGAGIVADSKPDREYKETVNKAQGMLRALNVGF